MILILLITRNDKLDVMNNKKKCKKIVYLQNSTIKLLRNMRTFTLYINRQKKEVTVREHT